MTSHGTAYGRFARAVQRGNVFQAEIAARELGQLSLADALSLCEMLAARDPRRFERAAQRWLQRFIDERSPSLPELALAAAALSDVRHGRRGAREKVLLALLRSASHSWEQGLVRWSRPASR
jgi:hypothetical protein